MALAPISAKASLDATEFTAGVLEIKKRLNELNTAYESNKAEMKQLGTEMNKLEREKRKLTEQMKDDGTDEQKKQLQDLNDKIAQVATQLGSMRTKEAELRSELKAATQVLDEEKKAASSASEGLEKQSDKTSELKNDTQSLETALKAVSDVLEDAERAAETSSYGFTVLRNNVIELNNALIEHRSKAKTVSEGLQELQKREKELLNSMKDGGTEEQKKQLEALREQITQASSAVGILNLKEEELKSALKASVKAFEEEKKAADSVADSLDEQGDETVELKNDTKELSNATDTATAAIKKLETGLKAVLASAAGKKLYEVLIGSNAEMEQYLTSFEVMLGDARKAKDLMSELNTMAAKTPMELTDVVKNGTQLMNYGVDPDKLIETMTKLGDLASGDAQAFERVSLAYGQMLAKGKVTNEELQQMTEVGVPLLQALADTMGITAGEVQDMASKSKVGINELNDAIESLTAGTGQFAGMMEKQSQTFSGMLSTLSDEAQQFGRDIGEKAFDVAKDSLSELLELIEEWRADGTLDELSEDVGEMIGNIATVAKDLLTFLVDNKETVLGAAEAFIALKGALAIKDAGSTAIGTIQGITKSLQAMGPAALATTAKIGGLAAVLVAVGLEAAYYIDKIAGVSDSVESAQRSVQRLTDRMNDSISANEAEMDILQAKAAEYETLRNTQDRSAAQEERLKALAGELQGVLGDEVEVVNSLTGEYNDLSAAIENYVEQQSKKVKFTALEDAAKEAYQKIEEIKRKMAERSEETAKYHESFHLLDWNGAVETNSFLNDMAAFREEIAKCQKIIDDYNDAVAEGAYQTAEASSAVDEATKKAAEFAEELARAEERTQTLNDLADATKNLVSEYSTLTEAYQKLESGEALNFQQMQALISVYPELAKHIQVTADGYTIEVDALAGLNNALLDGANAQIEAENAKTRAAIEGARERIRLYQKEAEAAGMYEHDGQKVLAIGHKISEEAAYIEQLEAQLAVNKSLPQYFQSNQGKSTSSSSSGKATTTTKEKEPPGLKSLMSYAKTTSAAFKEMNDNGELALSTVTALIDAGYESALDYDAANKKWTIDAKKYKEAAQDQITAAKDVEGVSETEKNALDTLAAKFGEVTEGVYGLVEAEEKLKTADLGNIKNDLKEISEAFREQQENGGKISFDTALSLQKSGYAAALTRNEDGSYSLSQSKTTELLQKAIQPTTAALREKKKAADNADEIAAIDAEISMWDDLAKSVGDAVNGIYEYEKAENELPGYSDTNSKMKMLSEAIAEQNENGGLSGETVEKLIADGWAEFLGTKDGVVTLDASRISAKLEGDISDIAAKLREQIGNLKALGEDTSGLEALAAVFEGLGGKVDDVTKGVYELNDALEELTTDRFDSDMTMLSKAIAEQNENGGLSVDTYNSLKNSDYGKYLTADIEGNVKIDTDKLKNELNSKLDKAIEDLEEKLKTAEQGDVPALKAQLAILHQLKDGVEDVTEGLYKVEQEQEKLVSDEVLKAAEDAADRRLKQIDAELKAKQRLRDETLKAIDDEVQARKRLTEDNDIERQIEQAMAQLKYSQLDEFSRAQLERKIQQLESDKADMLWERGIEDRKAAANNEYDTAADELNSEKEAINSSLEVLNNLNDTVANGIADLEDTIKKAMESVKPGSTINLTLNNVDKLTQDQLYKWLTDVFGSSAAI